MMAGSQLIMVYKLEHTALSLVYLDLMDVSGPCNALPSLITSFEDKNEHMLMFISVVPEHCSCFLS